VCCGAAPLGAEEYLMKTFRNLWYDDKAQDIAEYALMLATILLIVAATVSTIGTNAQTIFSNVANALSSS
jgi:Flp pilus assembly pilin Flp